MQVINVLQVSSKQTSAPIFHAYCFFLAVQAILPIYWLPLFTEGEWEYIACASHIIQQIIRFYCLGLGFFLWYSFQQWVVHCALQRTCIFILGSHLKQEHILETYSWYRYATSANILHKSILKVSLVSHKSLLASTPIRIMISYA